MRSTALLLFSTLFTSATSGQVPNSGFESTITVEDDVFPAEWSSPTEFGHGSLTDAHTGNYSLGVWTWYWYAEGHATNGNTTWPLNGGTPVQGRPTALTGWFKRLGGELQDGFDNDAHINVLLTRWNALTNQRDTVAQGQQAFGEQDSWAPFSIALSSLTNETPDTIVVHISSCGNCLCAGSNDGTCAYFLVDDLETVFATGLSAPLVQQQAAAGVSPAGLGRARVQLSSDNDLPLHLRVWDAVGRTVADVMITGPTEEVDLHDHRGLLTYALINTSGTPTTGRFVMP